MDIPSATPLPEQSEQHTGIMKHKKWVLGLIGVGIIGIVIYGSLSASQTQQIVEPLIPTIPPIPSIVPPFRTQPTSTAPEIQKAVDEAKRSAQSYEQKQAANREDYPWLRKFPLAGKGYFVYFDVQKKLYVARLYPTVNDNIPALKETVRGALVAREIPPDAFPFDWTIFPQ